MKNSHIHASIYTHINGKREGPKRRARGRKGRREEVRKEKEPFIYREAAISWNK